MFPNQETATFVEIKVNLDDEYKFRVDFLEDAKQFLDGLDEKARDKVYYNIWKARITNDKELFKKLQDEIWEFRTKLTKPITGYLLFGTKPTVKIPL